MGDYSKTLVRIDPLRDDERVSVCDGLTRYLVERGILIRAEASGTAWGEWCAGPDFRTALAEQVLAFPWDRMGEPGADGDVEIDYSRGVHDAGEWASEPYLCPACARALDDLPNELVETWHAHGEPAMTCTRCDNEALMGDWVCSNPWFLVGAPSVTFWNWPELSDRFEADLQQALGGRARWIYCSL